MDKEQKSEILNFSVDNSRRRLMILSGIKNAKKRRDKFITIYCLDNDSIVTRLEIKDLELIGRLKSNLYCFMDGHIYFNNKVIKIRYDLIESSKTAEIKEN